MSNLINQVIDILSGITFFEPEGAMYSAKQVYQLRYAKFAARYDANEDKANIEIIERNTNQTVNATQAKNILEKADMVERMGNNLDRCAGQLKFGVAATSDQKAREIEPVYDGSDDTVQKAIDLLKNITFFESDYEVYNERFITSLSDELSKITGYVRINYSLTGCYAVLIIDGLSVHQYGLMKSTGVIYEAAEAITICERAGAIQALQLSVKNVLNDLENIKQQCATYNITERKKTNVDD